MHRTCLTLCTIIRRPPYFSDEELGNILVIYWENTICAVVVFCCIDLFVSYCEG